MKEWIYKERKIVKFYINAIFIFGEIFLIAVACLVVHTQVVSSRNADVVNLLIVSFSTFIWTIIGVYAIYNTASALILRSDALMIEWSINRVTAYPWNRIKLKKIGLNKTPMIVADDDKWRLLKCTLPRYVLVDGSSKQYKEMIGKIENIKREHSERDD